MILYGYEPIQCISFGFSLKNKPFFGHRKKTVFDIEKQFVIIYIRIFYVHIRLLIISNLMLGCNLCWGLNNNYLIYKKKTQILKWFWDDFIDVIEASHAVLE